MNIFGSESSILGGLPEPQSIERAFQIFFECARCIRDKLGEKSYLADRYILAILDVLTVNYVPQVVDDGFDGMGPLHRRCFELVEDKASAREKNPFDKCAMRFLNPHLKGYHNKRTRINLLECAMFPAFCDATCRNYFRKVARTTKSKCDLSAIRQGYDEIASYLGGEVELEALNEAIRSAFLVATHMQVYLQGAIACIIDLLKDRDKETSKPIFAIMLDLEKL